LNAFSFLIVIPALFLKCCNLVKKQFGHIQRIMSTTPTAAMETLQGLPPLQLVVENEPRQSENRLNCSNHFKKSDWGHSAILKQRKITQIY
jgi:hypothetical protein